MVKKTLPRMPMFKDQKIWLHLLFSSNSQRPERAQETKVLLLPMPEDVFPITLGKA